MKRTLITTMIFIVLTLTACGSASDSIETASADPANSSEVTTPLSTELLVGTFKLEGTAQAVTTDQAAELLPLWQVYQSLSASDSAAQEEKDALVEQIQETMTSDQLHAINAMEISPQDIFAVMHDQGIAASRGQSAGIDGQNNSGVVPPEGGPPDGFVPGSGPGGGQGQGFGGGQNMSPEQIATAQARRAENGGSGFGTPSALVDALIELLESKAQ